MSRVDVRADAAVDAREGPYEIDRLMQQVRVEVQAQNMARQPVAPARLSTEEIIARVQEEVSRMRVLAAAQGSPDQRVESTLDRLEVVALGELLAHDDEAFIDTAYRRLLHREPDAEGRESRLIALRRARLTKFDILGQLRYSPEGRLHGVSVPGLWWRYGLRRAFRVPVLGRLLANVYYVVQLPMLARGLEETKTLVYRDLAQGRREIESQLARERSERELAVQAKGADLAATAAELAELRAAAQREAAACLRADEEAKFVVARVGADLASTVDAVAELRAAAQREAAERLHADEEAQSAVARLSGALTTVAAELAELRATAEHEIAERLRADDQTQSGVARVGALLASTVDAVAELRAAAQREADERLRADEEAQSAVARLSGDLTTVAAGLAELRATAEREIAERLRADDQTRSAVARVGAELASTGDAVAELRAAAQREAGERLRADEEAKSAVARLGGALTTVAAELAELRATVEREVAERRCADLEVRSSMARLEGGLLQQAEQLVEHRGELIHQVSRLAGVLEELEGRVGPTGAAIPSPPESDELEHSLDAFYVSFEDRFRGTRDDIRHRVSVYLPIIRSAEAGSEARPIVDIGCGRGEWLELLRDEGLQARGFDLNRVMVRQCQERGLDVSEGDALAWLRSLPSGSLGALTGFHLVEHLPFAQVLALFDEALRVLAPGGVVIFETPNPENLIVGSCTFYTDPTHRNPIPPEVLLFVAQARGFERAEINRLHPPHWSQNAEEVDGMAPRLKAAMTAPQDYSVIAFRPSEQPR